MTPLLEVRDLTVHFDTEDGTVEALDGVSFDVRPGEILGLVGESGSGKSVSALAVLRLIRRPGRIVRGAIRFEGRDLLALSEAEMRGVRGARISMVFQSPRTALNPVLTVGRQIARLYELHQGCARREAWRRTLDMLRLVGIPEPERRAGQYPHQLSGGMCQRVMIAMALATSPRLLLADESLVEVAAMYGYCLASRGIAEPVFVAQIVAKVGPFLRSARMESMSLYRLTERVASIARDEGMHGIDLRRRLLDEAHRLRDGTEPAPPGEAP